MKTPSKNICCLAILYFISIGIAGAQQFSNIATQANIYYGYGGHSSGHGGGVSLVDFNGDGLDDLTLATESGRLVKFFLNSPTGLRELNPLVDNTEAQKQILWADYDNDGDKDLLIVAGQGVTRLYQNNGQLIFIDVTTAVGLSSQVKSGKTAAFGDYDLDGWLDLYVANYFDENILYHNNGDGSFTDVTNLQGVSDGAKATYSTAFLDYNNDLHPELLVGSGRNSQMSLFENQQGTYVDKTVQSLLIDYLNPMNAGVADYDADGDLDIYITNTSAGDHKLYENNGQGVFTDIASQKNLLNNSIGWGGNWFDYDNDMDLDLYACTNLPFNASPATNYLYENTRNSINEVEFITHMLPNDTTRAFANAIGDIDEDGLLDVVLCGARDHHFVIWKNETQTNNNNWIKIKLEGVRSNRDGIGSWIEVYTNGPTQYKYTHCGEAFFAQNSTNHHIGLSQHTSIDLIKIRWPSGIIDSLTNVSVNQKINVREGKGILYVGNPTCFNGLKDGDELGVDCGGDFCSPCDCDDDIKEYTNTENFLLNRSFRYDQYVEIRQDALLLPKAHVEVFAEDYIEILKGEIGFDPNGSFLLDIDNCILKDFCYYSTLCNSDHFDYQNIDNYSIARIWMEVLLESIRNDFARPTIHARNLHHFSSLMYDLWLVYHSSSHPNSQNYLARQRLNGFQCAFNPYGLNLNSNDYYKAVSHAVSKLLYHRFGSSPASIVTDRNIRGVFAHYNLAEDLTSMNYTSGSPADVGNYIAQCYIDYGLQDGANEGSAYNNQYYLPVNGPLVTNQAGNPGISDPNVWQPLTLDIFIDQSGNQIPINTPDFLSPEWGNVFPFSMTNNVRNIHVKNGNQYNVYYDPGPPPLMDPTNDLPMTDEYVWGFMMVSIWGSHLDPADNTNIDISPASIGNYTNNWPTDFYGLPNFYDYFNGNDFSTGHSVNPITGQAYNPQIVKRGDYARVLAEFWADGPDSETPPGHWFTILNYVSDHSLFVKQFEGTGPVVDDLQWDVKSYFTLGGAMHDAAIAAWSIKGFYDYIRPVSAIRYMADQGQRTNSILPNYSPYGLPLIFGYSELVTSGDPLAGPNNEHLHKIKLKTWKGPDYINDPQNDVAGVDWILAENWWPYQRPSFVTPPFAGYVSGHSTFSRAAAEVLTLLTGDAFFPGGMGEFIAKQNDFLVFEQGPSQDITLQWATYRDASDQCSLSRIWGGIHPPADDIPGREIGEQIGVQSFNLAKTIVGF